MRSRIKSKREKQQTVIKWLAYTVLIALAYILMTAVFDGTPMPQLLILIALCISTKESELPSAVTGAVCGLMTDSACGKLIGFNGILIMCACMMVSLLFIHLLRQNFINVLMLTAGVLVLRSGLEFLFFYAVWGESGRIFTSIMLPSMIISVIVLVPIYYIIHRLHVVFAPADARYLEEKNENIIRE